jgi:hypothetical protein
MINAQMHTKAPTSPAFRDGIKVNGFVAGKQ